MKIIVFKSSNLWYFHFLARNGKIIAQSEGYKRKQACLKTVTRIKTFAWNAPTVIK